MIKYPNGNKGITEKKGKENTNYKNRGMNLETMINQTNQYYINVQRAIIHKKPTNIQIVKVEYDELKRAKVVEAYFKTPSTTDYNGIYQGKYVDFEAKETSNVTYFPLANIHEHQMKHLKDTIQLGGIGFFIISFVKKNEIYLVDGNLIYKYYQSPKSIIPYDVIATFGIKIQEEYLAPLNYLDAVDQLYFHEKG